MNPESQPIPGQNASAGRWMAVGVCVVLAALVWLVFGQAAGFEFVNYDDAENVSGNPQIAAGLGWHGIAWAFTNPVVGRWTPLTTLSHMADRRFFDLRAGRHHLVNVALHGLAAVLLFLALRELTGALWRSAFVAAVFAVHPLRAEVVGWISERGDLLAGVFFMLVLLAYARHARGPAWGAWYWGVVVLFALGLLCKPTILMLPFVLLLLDYWPLGRVTKSNREWKMCGIPGHLIMEKIPLFALSLAGCMAAASAQQSAATPIENLSLASRIGNALVSCVMYVRQMIYPAGLAAFYPYPKQGLPPWEALASLLLLAVVSAAVYAGRPRFQYAAVGWCWYLAMLLPVLGIVETGEQAHADRYTYLSQIGLYVIVAWGAADLSAKWEDRREILGIAAGVVLALLVFRARDQVSKWRDSVTLWDNAVANTGPNEVAEDNLGSALLHQGRIGGAMDHIRRALEIDPGRAEAHLSMGNALLESGRVDDAIAEYSLALQIRPGFLKAHINLGNALTAAGRYDEAIAEFQRALAINPGIPDAHNNLGEAFRRMGRLDDAIAQFRKALDLDPGNQPARDNLALALRQKAEQKGGVPH